MSGVVAPTRFSSQVKFELPQYRRLYASKVSIMKSLTAFLIASVLPTLITASNGVSLNLAGLRLDLEYLRGYWLKNPREFYRQGRIIFSNKNEIAVTFGLSPRPQERCLATASNPVDQWTTESLQLKNIHHLSSNTSTLSFSSLLYNHGTFYTRESSCDQPQVVEDDQFDLEIPPIMIQNDERKSVQVLYTDLKTLGYDIEREVSMMDNVPNKRFLRRKKFERRSDERASLFVNSAESEFAVEFEKGLRYVDVPHVRVLETSLNRGESSGSIYVNGVAISPLQKLPKQSQRQVSLSVSTDYSFIRYDRVTESFYTPGNELLDDHWFVRSFLGDYILKDRIKFRNIPSRSRISYSQVARSTVRTLAPIVKAGAIGLMHAMNGPLFLRF